MLIKYRYYLAFFLLAVATFLGALFTCKLNKISHLNSRLHKLSLHAIGQQRLSKKWNLLEDNYKQAEPFFIQNVIEKIELLKEEKTKLMDLAEANFYDNHSLLDQRLHELDKKMSFKEKFVHKIKNITEAEERLKEPVEINCKDLDRILSLVENVKIGSFSNLSAAPQNIIEKFSIIKTKSGTYLLDLNLFKREFINE